MLDKARNTCTRPRTLSDRTLVTPENLIDLEACRTSPKKFDFNHSGIHFLECESTGVLIIFAKDLEACIRAQNFFLKNK